MRLPLHFYLQNSPLALECKKWQYCAILDELPTQYKNLQCPVKLPFFNYDVVLAHMSDIHTCS